MTIDRILKSSIHHHGSVVMCEWKPSQELTPLQQQLAVAIFDKSHIIIIVTHVRCDFDLAENLLTIKSLPYQWYQSAKGLLLL